MIKTTVCDVLGIEHPVVQTGMAGIFTNPELVVAVSEAGGLGVLGCLGRTVDQARDDVQKIKSLTDRPFGVNFVLPFLDEDAFNICLEEKVSVFSFFRGDPELAVQQAQAIGAKTIHQITTVEEAQRACDVGVDVLVAQGCEGGGHVGLLPLLSLLPEVVAIAGSHPVLAAGGIVDGQGLAAALCFGASGILMGTRFLATYECSTANAHKQAIIGADLGDTIPSGVNGVWDRLWGGEWPGAQVRAIRNKMTEWVGREDELQAVIKQEREKYRHADEIEDPNFMSLMAGQGSGRIRELKPARQVVHDIVTEAEQILKTLGKQIQ